jgi:hypothetical protein
LGPCLDTQPYGAVGELFDSIEVAITKTLRIQKEERSRRNTLYIAVLMASASPKEEVLEHKGMYLPLEEC